jgi:AcrR family transcriptional regulator
MARITKDPETRRKEFIKAARELFLEKGFDKTSVNDITNKVGMSHGAFFYYFKSKNDIMKAVISDNLNYWKDFMTNLVDNNDINALQKMQTIFSLTIKSQRTKQNINKFFQKEGNAVMYREHIKKSREIILPLITQIVEQGVEKGLFNIEYPRETVEYVGYIVDNLGDYLNSAQSDDEYYRKIRALEIFLARVAGTTGNEFNLLGSEEK